MAHAELSESSRVDVDSAAARHPVLTEIERRRRGLPRTGRLALAIEGGGMRGVVSAGMVSALEEIGIKPNLFDAVFGSSAGAFTGAYYVAGQACFGTSVYYEDIIGPEFIDLKRLVLPGAALDLGHFFEHVIVGSKPLKIAEMLKTKLLFILATNVDSGEKEIFAPTVDEALFQKQLRAGATIPLVGGPPIKINGVRYMDASISEAIPWETPIDRGFDFVLVLRSRPLNMTQRRGIGRKSYDALWIRRYPKVRGILRERISSSVARTVQLGSHTTAPTTAPFIYAICPSESDPQIGQFERSPELLIAGAKSGYLATISSFGFQPPAHFATQGGLHGIYEPALTL